MPLAHQSLQRLLDADRAWENEGVYPPRGLLQLGLHPGGEGGCGHPSDSKRRDDS